MRAHSVKSPPPFRFQTRHGLFEVVHEEIEFDQTAIAFLLQELHSRTFGGWLHQLEPESVRVDECELHTAEDRRVFSYSELERMSTPAERVIQEGRGLVDIRRPNSDVLEMRKRGRASGILRLGPRTGRDEE
jgi:hypothetical protein